jgi:hypothetical protein
LRAIDLDADIDHLPMTPSTSSESPDERTAASPDPSHEHRSMKHRLHRSHPYHTGKSSSSILTNLDVNTLLRLHSRSSPCLFVI